MIGNMTINTKIMINGLWKQNSTLVQCLGLCPVLAVTSTAINALSLGITTTIVLICTNISISCMREYIPINIRIPIYMMIVSSVVSAIEMLLHAYAFKIYNELGIFIPLIVTNCIVVGRAEMVAIKKSFIISLFDGLFIGLGSTIAMFILGSIREIIGKGTIFNDIHIINDRFVVLLMIFPSGAFMVLAIMIAVKSWINIKKIWYKKNVMKNNIEIRTFFE